MTTSQRSLPGRRPLATLAGAGLAAALLAGAGTYALWGGTATVEPGTITSGNLDARAVGDLTWHGASEPDRLLPGDHAWAVQGFDLALSGNNLVVDATVSVAIEAEGTYPHLWFVSTDGLIADPWAALDASTVPGLVLSGGNAVEDTVAGLTEAGMTAALDGTADWYLYVLVENGNPPEYGGPDLETVTVRTGITLEQTP